MNDFSTVMADYLAGKAERDAIADVEIAAMKAALLPQLAAHGIITVEIRFDGYADSGAIEQTTLFDAEGKVMGKVLRVQNFGAGRIRSSQTRLAARKLRL